jgi:hypothetical protein
MKPLLDYEVAKEQMPVQKYREYLKLVRLEDVSLDSVDANINRTIMEQADTLGLKIDRELFLDNATPLQPHLVLDYQITGLSGRKQAVKIKAIYRLLLTSAETLPEEFFAIYGNSSADSQAWPFLRELAASLTSRMGAPRLLLPILTDPSVLNRPKKQTKAY